MTFWYLMNNEIKKEEKKKKRKPEVNNIINYIITYVFKYASVRARVIPVWHHPAAPRDWETETAVSPCTRWPWLKSSWILWVAWAPRWKTIEKLFPKSDPVCSTTCRSNISRGFPRRTAPHRHPPRNIHLIVKHAKLSKNTKNKKKKNVRHRVEFNYFTW